MNELLDDYRQTLSEPRGLGNSHYLSPEVFSREMQTLFRGSWMCVGFSSDAGAAGDVFPVEYAGLPILLVRGRDGKLRAFENACAHRGAVLATEPRACRRSIVCPYHAWAYDLEGALVRTPHAGGAGAHIASDFDASKRRLTELACAEWLGLVFVNADQRERPFEEFIAPLARRLAGLEGKRLVRDPELALAMQFDANWKLVVENFVESYHVPPVHPELEKVNPMKMHYQILGGHSYLGQGGDSYTASASSQLPLRPDGAVDSYESFYVFPNLIFGPLPDFAFVIITNPLSSTVTAERIEFFFYDDYALDDRHRGERQQNAEFLRLINSQDIGICEKVQKGRNCPGFDGGVFALPQEATSLQFLRMISARMLSAAEGGRPEALVELPYRDIRHGSASEPGGPVRQIAAGG